MKQSERKLTLLGTEISLTKVNPVGHLLEQIVVFERVEVLVIVNPSEVLKDSAAL